MKKEEEEEEEEEEDQIIEGDCRLVAVALSP
jgi:hypothetical protein